MYGVIIQMFDIQVCMSIPLEDDPEVGLKHVMGRDKNTNNTR
jgi:hypothetical protein